MDMMLLPFRAKNEHRVTSPYLFCCLWLPLEDGPPRLVILHRHGLGKGGVACLVLDGQINVLVEQQQVRALGLLAGDGQVQGTLAYRVL